MKFSQRVELVEKYNTWLAICNKKLEEKGDIAQLADCPLSVITFLDNKGYLSEGSGDIKTISEALIAICEHECCMYGMEEAVKLAEKYTEDI